MPAKRLSVADLLLAWYDAHARGLPWRVREGTADPYRVWLSEVMLQQTTVATVRPRFEAWVARWPTVEALAAADEADVMAAWAGLGYYARARNLVKAARAIVARGGFPRTEIELRALPGLGDYTAAAVAAIAFGERAVVVDANVERVVARLFAIDTPLPGARPLIRAAAGEITPDLRAGDFAQGMMDLGATICTTRKPRCLLCPLRELCRAFAQGEPERLPVKAAKKVRPQRYGTIFVLLRHPRESGISSTRGQGRKTGFRWGDGMEVLLVRRPDKGLLGGMRAFPTGPWANAPPGLDGAPVAAEWRLLDATVAHGFTHFDLQLALAVARAPAHGDPTGEWWPVADLGAAGLPTLFAKAARAMEGVDMKLAMVGSGLALVALTGAALAGQAQPQPQPQVQPRQAPAEIVTRERVPVASVLPNTQALFEGYVRDGKMPGIVGAFGIGDGPTLFPSAGRIADDAGAPVATADSLWRVYSMTKPVTAFAAMLLIEEGKIRLDQPISDFFPGFRSMKVLTSPDTSLVSIPAKTPITVRHLLTHTAGLGYTIISKGPIQKEYERLGIIPATSDAKSEAQARTVRPRTLAAFAERVATLPLVAEPGTKWSYSIGLDVMGAVIEKASGMPFDRFVTTRVFKPLGMTSSYWTVPTSEAGRFATNYVFVGDRRVPIDTGAGSVWLQPPSFPYGGAGLVMSARDYDRFLHMLADGGVLGGVRVAKAATVATMMSNLLPAGVTFGGIGGGTGGTTAPIPMGYGAGGSVYLADGPGGFPGKGTYGWGGAAGTIAFVDPSKRFRATVMVNYFPAEKWPLRAELARALGQDAARLAR